MRAPFALAEAEQLRALAAAGGFRDITIQSVAGIVRFPSISRFVQGARIAARWSFGQSLG
jgi:hypothetical protein